MAARVGVTAGRWSGATRELIRSLSAEVKNDRIFGLAAETAFFAVLSFFPGLLIAASLLSILDVLIGADLAAETQDRVVETLNLIFTAQAAETIHSVEAIFEGNYGGLLTIASLVALVTISGA